MRPTFTQHFLARLARGGRPCTGAKESDHWMWVRHIGCAESARGEEEEEGQVVEETGAVKAGGVRGVDEDVALLCLADMPPPAIIPRFEAPAPISSATWMINFLGGRAPAVEGGWFLLRSKAESARGGYSSQDMAIYGAGGAPIATGRQCVAIFDKPQEKKKPQQSRL